MKSRDLGSVFKNVIAKLIPDPVWYTDSFASQYHNAGSGISTERELSRSNSPEQLCSSVLPDRCHPQNGNTAPNNYEKNQRSAPRLYIAPGFAHTCSIVSTYGLI